MAGDAIPPHERRCENIKCNTTCNASHEYGLPQRCYSSCLAKPPTHEKQEEIRLQDCDEPATPQSQSSNNRPELDNPERSGLSTLAAQTRQTRWERAKVQRLPAGVWRSARPANCVRTRMHAFAPAARSRTLDRARARDGDRRGACSPLVWWVRSGGGGGARADGRAHVASAPSQVRQLRSSTSLPL